ncbi:MFS transporter [Kineococcus sp. SYSU DK003]|uniref:MFS transporter n=1 Tax=Kineococcus sp. SYSU DK003 TaxID=3383124 RepID=UPI003D7E8378
MHPSTTDPDWPVDPRTTRRVLLACWAAILAEGYDVGVLGAVLPSLADDPDWSLTPLELGGLGSYALVGMLIGASVVGTVSDRIGRRRMLIASLLVFSLTQAGAAAAPTPELFGVFRLLGGIGMGGIIPVAAAMTIEYSAPGRRSFNYGLMYSGYSLGILVAALVALVGLPHIGWRGVVAVGALPALMAPVLWRVLPESIESLLARGRATEARALAGRLGIEPFVEEQWTSAPDTGDRPDLRRSIASLFSSRYLRATVFFWLSLFCGMLLVYGLNTWLPAIMRSAGYELGSSLMFLVVFSLASAIGGVVLGRLADRHGKKLVLLVFYSLGSAGVLCLMFPNALVVNYLFVSLAGIGSISTSLVLTGWVADYYPAAVRATGTGFALSFARIGAISGPLIGGWISEQGFGREVSFATFAVVGVAATLAVAAVPRQPKAVREQVPA